MRRFLIPLIMMIFLFVSGNNIQAQYFKPAEVELTEDIYDVYSLASPSVVTVLGERKWNDGEPYTMGGSGVLINNSGHILTAYHVIDESTNIRVYKSGARKRFSAEIIEIYPEKDLALLRVSNEDIYDYYKPIKTRSLGDMADMQSGQAVYSLGRFGGDTCFIRTGTLMEIVNQPLDEEHYNYIPQVVFNASLHDGFSGGALVDDEGYLLGIISNRDYEDHRRNYAIVP